MGLENQPATKDEKPAAEAAPRVADVQDYQKPSLAGADVAWNLATIAADKPTERRSETASSNQAGDWRTSMQQITTSLEKLDRMSVSDPERTKLIDDIDKRFQFSIPEMAKNATNADARLIVGVVQAEKAEQRLNDLLKDKEVTDLLAKINVKPENVNGDDVRNAILNATTDSERVKFTEILTLGQMQAHAGARADDAYWAQRAPLLASLQQAEFLIRYKNGVSTAPDGEVFSAVTILNGIPSEELLARTDTREVQQAAGANAAVRQAEVVPADKNPLITLEGSKAATNPAEQLIKAQYAVVQANDKLFEPADIQKRIVELKASGDDSPETLGKIAAWQELSQARGRAEIWLAYQMFQQETPDFKGILEHIQNAKKDPEAIKLLQLDGKPLHEVLEVRARAAFEGQTIEKMHREYMTQMKTYKESFDAMADCSKDGDEKQAKNHLNTGYDALSRALTSAREINDFLGPNRGKIDEELQRLKGKPEAQRTAEEKNQLEKLKYFQEILRYESMALLQLSQLDLLKGNPDMALLHSGRIEQADPNAFRDEEFRKAYDELRKEASSASEYEHASFLERRWEDLKGMPSAAWDWIKNHGRIVGMVTGFLVAAAITAGTGGLGAGPAIAAYALIAGAVGGGLVGTGVGAGLEVYSGQQKDFWSAAADVAPYAFTGSIAGAALVATPSAVGAANGARFTSLMGTQAAPKLVMPFINAAARPILYNTVRGGVVWGGAGLAYNTGRVRDGYAANKYSSGWEAAGDFASGEAEFIGNGMLYGGAKGKAFLGLSLAKNTAIEVVKPHGIDDLGTLAKNVAFRSGDDYLNRGLTAFTGRIPIVRNAPVLTDPFLRMSVSEGQVRQITGMIRGYTTGNSSDLTDAERKQFHMPALKPSGKPSQPGQPGAGEPAKPEEKSAFDAKSGDYDLFQFDEKKK
jgi:hypothetical protein